MTVLAGCVVTPEQRISNVDYDARLLTGVSIFGEAVAVNETEDVDVLATTPEMHEFVADIKEGRLTVIRYRKLLDKLRASGFFDNVYDPTVTRTAAQTFEGKVGNCISYTSLFVALARAADLEVSYQIVEVPFPSWDVDSGLLIRNNHINVLVSGARFYRNRTSGHTIDFNLVDPEPNALVRKVSDGYAKSLFYANWSVDALLRGEERIGFSYLRRALELEPSNADLWINLAAFYGRYQQYEDALASFEVAAALDPSEKLTLSGLERTHRALGNIELADELARQVRRYRMQNPYYHFAVAQTAYDEGDFDAALQAVDQALRMKRRNSRFHYLKGLTLARLGDADAAARSIKRAKRYGRYDDLRRRYGELKTEFASG